VRAAANCNVNPQFPEEILENFKLLQDSVLSLKQLIKKHEISPFLNTPKIIFEGFAKPRYVVIPNLFQNPLTLQIINKQ
jgi:hypothetical protein